MRQGALQPLSVTTGLNGRPLGGEGGGVVVGVVTICASGIEAAPALETSPAASMVVAPAKNVLRETISFPFFNVRAIRRHKFVARFHHCGSLLARPIDGRLQIRLRQPKIALRLDCAIDTGGLLARVC